VTQIIMPILYLVFWLLWVVLSHKGFIEGASSDWMPPLFALITFYWSHAVLDKDTKKREVLLELINNTEQKLSQAIEGLRSNTLDQEQIRRCILPKFKEVNVRLDALNKALKEEYSIFMPCRGKGIGGQKLKVINQILGDFENHYRKLREIVSEKPDSFKVFCGMANNNSLPMCENYHSICEKHIWELKFKIFH